MSIELSTKDFAGNLDKVKADEQRIQPQLSKVETEQLVKPQKPMSIEQYTAALKKEHEVARLRAGIAKFMFEENMAMLQLNQMRAGQHAVQQGQMQAPEQEEATNIEDQIEDNDREQV